ncbi:MAG: N-acetylmuramoyl-L-alanine amidase [Gammaproteobacteria bacterium]|nr:N-acetylmuramoyl-L-alanine amidase [Gammaproteobacteria bacterium]MBT8132879.1 N-acetylmuramoyl-L-alanine amidase [Gammaproteobacteria bacterium]NNJ49157.1 AMIN domain-containing protein [Gammaproteobacteria bacterium]
MVESDRRKFLKSLAGLSGLAASAVPGLTSAKTAAGVQVKDIRLSKNKNYVRLVFDLDKIADHSLFALQGPDRVVLDVKNAKMPHGMVDRVQANSLIRSIRSGVRNDKDLRVVFDLSEEVSPRSFLLAPSGKSGHRLVIDLHGKKDKTKAAKKKSKRDVIIAIDAGHGGKDPGATGRSGTHEKIVTLQIAKRLEKDINAQRGMKAVLVRKNDRYMRLRDRIHKARDHHADMMISLHADSFPDPRARGSSIYALSVDGATSETARMLAEKENAADILFGDVDLAVEDQMVKEVLFDLSLTGTIESSLDIGSEILGQLKTVNRVHKKKVQQAGFAVLKAPNIPSVLLETAFISNPREEKNLRSAAHQKKISKAITRGVNKYFSRKAPPGTWLASSECEYAVCQGDNVAKIADKYDVNESDLRARNSLYADNLLAGQVIKIPVS